MGLPNGGGFGRVRGTFIAAIAMQTAVYRRVSGSGVLGIVVGIALTWGATGGAGAAEAEDLFAAGVRTTEPRVPMDQQPTLKVPPGFVVQLVAAEPDVHKPMNLAFDATGRLWVTTSREYPFPAPLDQPGRDRVMVFEDFGEDGRARKVTQFAGGLNIPTGVYPFRTPGADGRETWKSIVWSIPNIWLLEDVDGDGKADRKEPWYGPFDHTRDTHGNQSSFRRGFDGWLYATHGFNNDSHVTSRDGNRVDLNSGNTYRMRMDGGRIEHHTWGQVNPFGLAWDAQGNLYSSDCHSEPIYLLQYGGYYPSFGKPHDGLGFAPNTMEAIRGSTAIDGISYYTDDLWPEEYRDSVFVGDVMNSRVFRDYAEPRGSGKVMRARPDFVISEDPWFRPVDTLLGPDGALYIADFYNRIIGHYEVPLSHPGRDRERGRIWRVVPVTAEGRSRLRDPAIAQDLEGQIRELGSPSLARRMLAMNDLADRFGNGARERLLGVVRSPRNDVQRVHASWLVQRLGGMTPELLRDAARGGAMVRIHGQRIGADVLSRAARGEAVPAEAVSTARELAVRGLEDMDPVVRRCAAEALSMWPDAGSVRPLLALLAKVPREDTHLVYGVRKSLRDHVRKEGALDAVSEATGYSREDLKALVDVAVAVKTESAARFLIAQRGLYAGDAEFTQTAFTHAARYAPASEVDTLVAAIRQQGGGDVDFQARLYRSLRQGLDQRGVVLTSGMAAWGGQLAKDLLGSGAGAGGWVNRPLDAARNVTNPWDFEERVGSDGRRTRLLSSLPRGEALTGVLRSAPFRAPAMISFDLAGHDGAPGQPAGRKNAVRLRDAETGAVWHEAWPPRDDRARRVEWAVGARAGGMAVLEVVDGDVGGAFAWLAFGRIEPASIPMPTVAPATAVARQIAAAEIGGTSGDGALREAMARVMGDRGADPGVRAAMARGLSADPLVRAAAEMVGDAALPEGWRSRAADVLFDPERRGAEELIAAVWKDAPHRFQLRFAGLAASNPRLTEEMVTRMSEGRAPAGLLLDKGLRDRLRRSAGEATRGVLDRMLAALPDEDEAARKLLEARKTGFASATTDANRGRDVFVAACAACHQINGQGGLVGPQLSGIGTRGAERLCEDILVPNRNVDHAFWTTVLNLKDGESISGLFRREEGELLVLANAAGAEFTVKKSEVASRKESNVSVMPSNFGDALAESDFHNLLAYLLGQTGK